MQPLSANTRIRRSPGRNFGDNLRGYTLYTRKRICRTMTPCLYLKAFPAKTEAPRGKVVIRSAIRGEVDGGRCTFVGLE